MASFDYSYLQNLMAGHLASSVSLFALTSVVVSAGLWHFRPHYNRGDVRSGLALFAVGLASYAFGSYIGNQALHVVSLIGLYLAFVTALAGKEALVSIGPSLLPLVAIFVPGFVGAPSATALQAITVAAMTGYVLFLWRTRGSPQPVCPHCFESKLSRQRHCLHCGRRIEGDDTPFPKSVLAYGGLISAMIIALSLVTIPVFVSTPMGPSYATLGIRGATSLVPLWSVNSTSPSPQFKSTSNEQGLGQVYVYSNAQASSNTTLWTMVSQSRLSNVKLLIIFPGLSSNFSQGASGNITLGYSWSYQGTSYKGSIGSASAYMIVNGAVNKVSVTYLAGRESRTKSLPQLESQFTLLVSDRINAAANFEFLLQAFQALTANSQYLETAVSVVLLLGVVRTARERDVNFAKAMENAQGLSRKELELLLVTVTSGKDRTGKQILDAAKSTLGLGWYELLPYLLRFQELGLVGARISSDQGVPTLKWTSRFR